MTDKVTAFLLPTFAPPLEELNRMNATEVARRYHEMWNGGDADALVGCFTEDGIFCNPDTYPGIGGEALANFVKGVWAAVPDFSTEMLNAGEIEPGIVAHQWRVRGTATGPGMDGSAPSGDALNFQGTSIVTVKGDKIRLDQAYFDRKAFENP